MPNFAQRLKQLRVANHLSQKKLAEKLNVSQNAIFNWENEKREPGTEMIEKIATIFNVTPAYMMGWDKDFDFEQVVNHSFEILNNFIPPDEEKKVIDRITTAYESMNNKGKYKAAEQMELLASIPEYQRSDE